MRISVAPHPHRMFVANHPRHLFHFLSNDFNRSVNAFFTSYLNLLKITLIFFSQPNAGGAQAQLQDTSTVHALIGKNLLSLKVIDIPPTKWFVG